MKRSALLMMLGAAAMTHSYSPGPYRGHVHDLRPRGNTFANGKYFRHESRTLSEFTVKGHKVMAYSKKDAIKRLKHQKLI